jgi:hypothetical protein
MKLEITHLQVSRTAHFTIEDEDGKEYIVNFAENDVFDEWRVMDEDGKDIDHDVDLYDTLITMCNEELNK